jgi:hypothetical protein
MKNAASSENNAISDEIAYNGTLYINQHNVSVSISERVNGVGLSETYMIMIRTTALCKLGFR